MRPEDTPYPRPHRLDQDFTPKFCPKPDCASRTSSATFHCCRRGRFTRAVDLRIVQRYRCLVCNRSFSSQTFRIDYRYQRPRLHLAFFPRLVAKCSIRQAARELCCHRDSLLLRLARLGPHARWLNEAFLERHMRRTNGIRGPFLLDELETFETDRRLFPVTVPVLVHEESRFIVHVAADTIPARSNLRPADQRRLALAEAKHGKRLNRSHIVVTESFRVLKRVAERDRPVDVRTDRKTSYGRILLNLFRHEVRHERIHSTEPRGAQNALFAVNHTLAMLRDGVGRLVRRSWCHAKLRRNLGWHLWVWVLYRNYVRELTVLDCARSSASMLKIVPRRLDIDEVLEWTDRLPTAV